MSDDVLARAKAALEGVAPLPWSVDPDAYFLSDDDGLDNDKYWDVDGPNGGWLAHCQDLPGAQFVAVARALVPELVAEVTRLRRVTDIIDPDSVYREQAEHWKSLWRQNTATAADAMRERDAAVAELEQVQQWHSSQADKLERVLALAEKWRYKGEFGWGAWQEGHGPDETGYALDSAASELRAALGVQP